MRSETTHNGAAVEDVHPVAVRDHASLRLGPADRDAILTQLERLLSSPPFRTSKRHPRFMRYVVEETLSGRSEAVKERVIAVAVFDRSPDYDSNIDPVVRVAAGDIRKRIAQYYVQPGHELELRIELLPGSYVPTFFLPDRRESASISETNQASTLVPAAEGDSQSFHPEFPLNSSVVRGKRTWAFAALCALISVTLFFIYIEARPETNLRAFWGPFLSGSGSSLILVADILSVSDQPKLTAASDPTVRAWILGANHVAYGDVSALTSLTGEFQREKRQFRVLMANSVEFSELRGQPLVLVGGGDNPWAKRFQSGMRYTVEGGPDTQRLWIRDEKSSNPSKWTIEFSDHLTSFTRDFGIVTRFSNTSIEQPTLMLTGLGPYATTAAGEFITNPQYFSEFTRVAPKDWAHKNLQIVIETEVVNGQSGPPHMVGYYVW